MAADAIQQAFHALKSIATPNDARSFTSTTLQDVRVAARKIERELEARRSICNMRRLEPLLKSLEHYARPIEVLCNGTPYLPWIWAPIKLILQIASDYADLFKHIIDAYDLIAQTLPRIDKLHDAFKKTKEFGDVVAVFCADIVHFHTKAYELVKQNQWRLFFKSTWGRFQRQFQGILKDLRAHARYVEDEAYAQDIHESAKHREQLLKWRDEDNARIAEEEKHQAVKQAQAISSWLGDVEAEQRDLVNKISAKCCPGTCEWIVKQRDAVRWLRKDDESCVISLIGKPGAGKSVMMSRMATFALADASHDGATIILHHFCSHASLASLDYAQILRSLLAQLLSQCDHHAGHVYDEYVVLQKAASPSVVEKLLHSLLPATAAKPSGKFHVKLLVDGVDECTLETQRKLLNLCKELVKRCSVDDSGTAFKAIVASQDTAHIGSFSKGQARILLNDERQHMEASITTFLQARFESIPNIQQLLVSSGDLDRVKSAIARRSNGMFLWARLVCDLLLHDLAAYFTVDSMLREIEDLPRGMTEFYARVLQRMTRDRGKQVIAVMRDIMAWICFAQRPLKTVEIRSFLAKMHGLDRMPQSEVLDVCKPLVELTLNEDVNFVHNSVQQYLLEDASGPFISQQTVLAQHAEVCVKSILDVKNLMSQSRAVDAQSQIVHGTYGSFVYACTFWVEHLLSWALQSQNCLLKGRTRPEHVEEICVWLVPDVNEHARAFDDVEGTMDARLPALESWAVVHRRVKALLVPANKRLTKDDPNYGIHELLCSYQAELRDILRKRSISGVSSTDLAQFKDLFHAMAFTCSWKGCPRSSSGFKSIEEKDDHERVHTKLLMCTEPGCKYGLPFKTSRQLREHIGKIHPSEIPARKPPARLHLRKATVLVDPLNPGSMSALSTPPQSLHSTKTSTTEEDCEPSEQHDTGLDAFVKLHQIEAAPPSDLQLKRSLIRRTKDCMKTMKKSTCDSKAWMETLFQWGVITDRYKEAISSPGGNQNLANPRVANAKDPQCQPSTHKASGFEIGDEVFSCEHIDDGLYDPHGEGILCRVTAVIGSNYWAQYQVRDVDDTENSLQPFWAIAKQLTLIPPRKATLAPFDPGTAVVALYPDTTTFYKGEVVAAPDSDLSHVRVRFEGQNKLDSDKDIERRYVLIAWARKHEPINEGGYATNTDLLSMDQYDSDGRISDHLDWTRIQMMSTEINLSD